MFPLHLLSFFLALNLVLAADLYKILDLDRSASDRDIRHAYKKLSKKYHPDKNKDPEAENKFVDIAHAYEVLSDETAMQKRRVYDQHGEEGLKAHESGQGHRHQDPFSMFSNFFGGHGHSHEQVRRGPSSLTEFEVQLEDMYTGASIDFIVKKKVLCDHCRGSGAASDSDIHTCGGCGGSGMKVVKQQIFPGMFAQSQTTCNECGGRGKVVKHKCPHCNGNKVVDHSAHYTLEVTPGMPEEHQIVFEGEADESPDWEAGDVVLRVRSRKQKGGWRRKENNLYWKETIGVDEALLGFERNVTHLDGRTVTLHRTGVTQPGFVETLEGEGMPVFEATGHGDLFVEYNVVLPTELTPQTKQKLADVFGASRSAHDEL